MAIFNSQRLVYQRVSHMKMMPTWGWWRFADLRHGASERDGHLWSDSAKCWLRHLASLESRRLVSPRLERLEMGRTLRGPRVDPSNGAQQIICGVRQWRKMTQTSWVPWRGQFFLVQIDIDIIHKNIYWYINTQKQQRSISSDSHCLEKSQLSSWICVIHFLIRKFGEKTPKY